MRGASRCFLKTPIFLNPDHLLSVCKPGPVFSPTGLSGKGRYPQFQRGMKNQGCARRDTCHGARGVALPRCLTCNLEKSCALARCSRSPSLTCLYRCCSDRGIVRRLGNVINYLKIYRKTCLAMVRHCLGNHAVICVKSQGRPILVIPSLSAPR